MNKPHCALALVAGVLVFKGAETAAGYLGEAPPTPWAGRCAAVAAASVKAAQDLRRQYATMMAPAESAESAEEEEASEDPP